MKTLKCLSEEQYKIEPNGPFVTEKYSNQNLNKRKRNKQQT